MVSKPAAFTELISCCVTIGLPQAVSPPIASREFPKFQPTPICPENSTALIPPLEEDDDEDEELLEELDELEEVDELELLEELLPLQVENTPPSPHWSLQVFAPMQL